MVYAASIAQTGWRVTPSALEGNKGRGQTNTVCPQTRDSRNENATAKVAFLHAQIERTAVTKLLSATSPI